MRFDFKITNMLDPIFIISIFSIIFLDLKPRIIISNCENKLLNLFGLISLLCPGLKDITTPDFSTPDFSTMNFSDFCLLESQCLVQKCRFFLSTFLMYGVIMTNFYYKLVKVLKTPNIKLPKNEQ